jgi:FAD/FMN-containing dehydrogenase
LCNGVVIDLSGMRSVAIASNETAEVSGGARSADVLATTDSLGRAPVKRRVQRRCVGLTLGGDYGPLIGRFGLALDKLEAAQVVLANGCVVVTDHKNEEELFGALRGGNCGVVTAMRLKLHRLPSVSFGLGSECRSAR